MSAIYKDCKTCRKNKKIKSFFSRSQNKVTEECKQCRAKKFSNGKKSPQELYIHSCDICGIKEEENWMNICPKCHYARCDVFENCSLCDKKACYCYVNPFHPEEYELAKCPLCEKLFCGDCHHLADEYIIDCNIYCEKHKGKCKVIY